MCFAMVCVLSMSDRAIRTVSIVGARPQFVKLSPVSRAMTRGRSRIDDRIVHTGQHYDDAMSRVFFEELELPQPAVNLGIGSGPQGWQTGRMLEAIEAYESTNHDIELCTWAKAPTVCMRPPNCIAPAK